MPSLNAKRVWVGGLFGGILWNVWSFLVNGWILGERYNAAQKGGEFLQEPRYPFMIFWVITVMIMGWIAAWAYASVRNTLGPGPWTAVRVGFFIGFLAGFPINLSLASWLPLNRFFPLWWMIELWVGAIVATFVAGWYYKAGEEG